MNEAVTRWELRRIVQDNCPLCLTHFAPELVALHNVVYTDQDPLPRECFYEILCPNEACEYQEFLVVMRSKYLQGLAPLHEALQAVGIFLADTNLQCSKVDCEGILGRLFPAMQDETKQRFQLQAYCQGCEEINLIHIGWKVINLPVELDPAIRARKALRLIDTVPQLLAQINNKP